MNPRRILISLVLVGVTGTHVAVLAQEELVGMFRLRHTTMDIVGPQMAQALNEVIPSDAELQWQVYVPERYDRRRPAGVFVFIDPNGWGGMPDQWRQVFDNHNMIWIGAKSDQRNPPEARKVWAAILGSRAIEQDYAIDLNRLYIGSSGSNAMTAVNTMLFANEFVGAVYMSGSMYWGSIDPEKLEALRRKHHVFITGTNDKAKTSVRADYENYKKDGIENVKLIFEMNRLGKMPKPEHMDEAIRYLDSRLSPSR